MGEIFYSKVSNSGVTIGKLTRRLPGLMKRITQGGSIQPPGKVNTVAKDNASSGRGQFERIVNAV